jgi:hypothetical protein
MRRRQVASSEVEEATALLAEVDPLGFIADGCPADEYQAEAEHLLGRREPVTPEDVSKAFMRRFGAKIDTGAAVRVSDGLAQIRAGHSGG